MIIWAGPSLAKISNNYLHQNHSVNVKSGNVLPPNAIVKGYSLEDIAEASAYFNTSDREGTPPEIPFQILYTSASNPNNTFIVKTGTMFYAPILYNDDTPPILGGPENWPSLGDRDALLNYFYSQELIGLVSTEIKIDGKLFSLGSDYLVHVQVPALADGEGTEYQTIAACITPLSKGVHQVKISGKATGLLVGGDWSFTLNYKVIVR